MEANTLSIMIAETLMMLINTADALSVFLNRLCYCIAFHVEFN